MLTIDEGKIDPVSGARVPVERIALTRGELVAICALLFVLGVLAGLVLA